MPPAAAQEADEIVLSAFKQIDCPIGEDVRSLAQISPELLVFVCARSLFLISEGSLKFPVQLPGGIAARHRICTDMAAKIKELGYPGDCGYNQLLYPTEDSMRDILNWLMNRLPRSEEDRTEEVLGPNALLNRRIMGALEDWRSAAWKMPFCFEGSSNVYRPLHRVQPLQTFSPRQRPGAHYVVDKIPAGARPEPTVFEQHAAQLVKEAVYQAQLEITGLETTERAKAPIGLDATLQKAFVGTRRAETKAAQSNAQAQSGASLAELIQNIDNAASAPSRNKNQVKGTRFTHAAEFAQERSVPAQDVSALGPMPASAARTAAGAAAGGAQAESPAARQRGEADQVVKEEELEQLRNELEEVSVQTTEVTRQRDAFEAQIRQAEAELAQLTSMAETLEREYLIKRRTLEMLPKASENIQKLQAICAQSARKLMELAQEWETHRRPLIDAIRAKQDAKNRRKERCKAMVEEMKKYRSEMQGMLADLREKEDRQALLEEELNKLPKNINRTLYTYRIMDIISSINKQQAEISRIVGDIGEVRKQINAGTNTLKRADAVAEEKIYQAANGPHRDESTIACYRNLTIFRERFDALIETVRQVGQREAEERTLETKIDQELSRVSATNFERIRNDLEQVRTENAQLIARLKKGGR